MEKIKKWRNKKEILANTEQTSVAKKQNTFFPFLSQQNLVHQSLVSEMTSSSDFYADRQADMADPQTRPAARARVGLRTGEPSQ